MTPFVRNLLIIACVAGLLDAETALATAGTLLRAAFIIMIGVVAYFFWRDFGRREIDTWDERPRVVFYGGCAVLLADFGWWLLRSPQGRDALVAIVVAAICAYVLVRTWREQHRFS
jgi:hypothetical protein